MSLLLFSFLISFSKPHCGWTAEEVLGRIGLLWEDRTGLSLACHTILHWAEWTGRSFLSPLKYFTSSFPCSVNNWNEVKWKLRVNVGGAMASPVTDWREDGEISGYSGGASGWGVVEKLRFNSVGRWCLEITAVSNSARSGIGSWWHRGLVVRLKSGDCRSRWTGFASPMLRGWRSNL